MENVKQYSQFQFSLQGKSFRQNRKETVEKANFSHAHTLPHWLQLKFRSFLFYFLHCCTYIAFMSYCSPTARILKDAYSAVFSPLQFRKRKRRSSRKLESKEPVSNSNAAFSPVSHTQKTYTRSVSRKKRSTVNNVQT